MTNSTPSHCIRGKIVEREEKKAAGWMQSSPVFVMIWMGELKLQVDKPPSQLNQALVKPIVSSLSSLLEPEVLQHIMRLVVPLGIEALEVAEIAGVKSSAFCSSHQVIQRSKELLHPRGFLRTPCAFFSARVIHHVNELRVAPW